MGYAHVSVTTIQIKVEKGGHTAWTDVFELSNLLREGTTKWEDLNLDDIDVRLKWAGLFHRSKRTPTKFMMRLKVSTKLGQQQPPHLAHFKTRPS